MKRARARGDGSITQRKDGRFEGRGLGSVEPEQVAVVIANALQRGGGSTVAGPAWLDPLSRVVPIVPRRLIDVIRTALGDDRLLTRLDHEARSAYAGRLASQASSRSKPATARD